MRFLTASLVSILFGSVAIAQTDAPPGEAFVLESTTFGSNRKVVLPPSLIVTPATTDWASVASPSTCQPGLRGMILYGSTPPHLGHTGPFGQRSFSRLALASSSEIRRCHAGERTQLSEQYGEHTRV